MFRLFSVHGRFGVPVCPLQWVGVLSSRKLQRQPCVHTKVGTGSRVTELRISRVINVSCVVFTKALTLQAVNRPGPGATLLKINFMFHWKKAGPRAGLSKNIWPRPFKIVGPEPGPGLALSALLPVLLSNIGWSGPTWPFLKGVPLVYEYIRSLIKYAILHFSAVRGMFFSGVLHLYVADFNSVHRKSSSRLRSENNFGILLLISSVLITCNS